MTFTLTIFVVLFGWAKFSEPADSSLLVRNTSSGLVRGRHLKTARGVEGYLFQGIPYAQPPVGKLRFDFPQQVKPWQGILNASEYRASCYWNTTMTADKVSSTPMSEDCLYVNVFTSERCLRLGSCAVMHYIYGGQFCFGSPRKFLPEIIVNNFCNNSRDIVVVTFAYRMNVFGLLNLNYKMVDLLSPNIAVHDMLESLRWTKREIANFGGNPQRVTLMGHSSGSVATQILMVCPRAQEYFGQTVSMSGPGTIEPLPKNRNHHSSRRLALSVGCVNQQQFQSSDFWEGRQNVSNTLECLRSLPASALSSQLIALEREGIIFHGLSQEIGPKAIVTDTYLNLVKKHTPSYPVLTGTVSKEYRDGLLLVDPGTGKVDRLKLWLYCKRIVGQYNYEHLSEAVVACVEEYDDVERATYLYEDAVYFTPHFQFASRSARKGSAYLYQFEYDGIEAAFTHQPDDDWTNYGVDPENTSPENTPHHAQDLVYLFGQNAGNFTEKDRRIQYLHSELFANFIRTGDPNGIETHGFQPFNPSLNNFFKIDFLNGTNGTSSFVGESLGYHERAVRFWNERMSRVGGLSRPLTDEIQVDDKMTSYYIPGDLESVRSLIAPWEGSSYKLALCQVLFYVAAGLAVLLFVLLLLECCKRRRKRVEYVRVE